MYMKEYIWIKTIKNNNIITNEDIDKIWLTYHKTFGVYPNGKKTCTACLKDSINNLYKHFVLKELIN